MPLRVAALLPLMLLLAVFAACSPGSAPTEVALLLAPNRILAFWQTVDDRLDGTVQGHPWVFNGRAGDAIHLRLNADSADITLTLDSPDGTSIARGNDVQLTLPADGVYNAVIRAAPGSTGVYSLTLEYTDRPDPSQPTATPTPTSIPSVTPTVTPTPSPTLTLTPTPVYASLGAFTGTLLRNAAIGGTISHADDRHVYLFDGDAGHYVNVQMARITGPIDPVLTLYDPLGQPVAMDDNSGGNGDALLRNIVLPQSGEYILLAAGDGQPGEYRLRMVSSVDREPVTPNIPAPTFTPVPTTTPAPRIDRLVDHVAVAGRVAQPGDFLRYPIVAVQGEVFTVGISPLPGFNLRPTIELYSPSGELVTSASSTTGVDGGDAVIPAYTATESGTYVALIEGESGTTGDFVIAYGLGASRENVLRGPVSADSQATGEIARRGLRDVWTIALNAGDEITLTANPNSSTFDPAVDLVAPDGTVLASDDNSGGGRVPLVSRVRAPQTGLYALRVTGANAASSGVYTLVWRYIVAAPTPTPPAASILILSADSTIPAQTYRFFPFQGQIGQRVLLRVQAEPGSAIDPVLALLDAQGSVIAEADDNGTDLNPVLAVTLPATGTFLLRVNGYGDSSGEVNVTVEALY